MEFFRQESWSGLPFLSLGDLPDPGIELAYLVSPAGRFFTRQVIRKSYIFINNYFKCHWAIYSNPNRVAERINNQAPTICCLQETYLRAKETHRLKVRGWKKIFQVNGNSKKAEVTILISDKTDFKTKAIIKIKKGTI